MVDSYNSRRFPMFHLKIRADLTQFTTTRLPYRRGHSKTRVISTNREQHQFAPEMEWSPTLLNSHEKMVTPDRLLRLPSNWNGRQRPEQKSKFLSVVFRSITDTVGEIERGS